MGACIARRIKKSQSGKKEMIIGWKEIILVVAIVLSSLMTILMLLGIHIFFINDWNTATIVIVIFGFITLILSGVTFIGDSINASIIATLFAVSNIGVALLAIIFNSKFFFIILAIILVGFWIVVLANNIRERLFYHSSKKID